MQPHRRQIWLVQYAPTAPFLTPDAIDGCDECYGIEWQGAKYTLLHLKQGDKTRATALSKALIGPYQILMPAHPTIQLIARLVAEKSKELHRGGSGTALRQWLRKQTNVEAELRLAAKEIELQSCQARLAQMRDQNVALIDQVCALKLQLAKKETAKKNVGPEDRLDPHLQRDAHHGADAQGQQ